MPDNKTSEDKTLDLLVMRKPQWGEDSESGSSSAWLVSFTDVVALMLTFFVLLYAMSDPVYEKWENKIDGISSGAAEYSGPGGFSGMSEGININRVDYNDAENIDYVEAILEEILSHSKNDIGLSLARVGNDLKLTVHKDIFDDKGRIKRRSLRIIRQLASAFNGFDNRITLVSQMTGNKDENQFQLVQIIGKSFKKSGYKKNIKIALRGDVVMNNSTLQILIQPHDGRRISR